MCPHPDRLRYRHAMRYSLSNQMDVLLPLALVGTGLAIE
jgi:hypothetical protein